MKSRPLISIIIPVYKVEKYLVTCIESVIKQTYQELEIFLIDDGSPDNCGIICDEYALEDSRIKVIHKINGGLSDARNAALDLVNGEYITFIDSDDYITTDYVSVLYNTLTKYDSDISVCQYCTYNEGNLSSYVDNEGNELLFDNLEAIRTIFYHGVFDTSAWGKLYKRHLFDEVRYPKGYIFEDLGTTYKVFYKAHNVAYIGKKMYYYQIRNDSLDGKNFNNKKFDGLEIADRMLEDVRTKIPQCYKAAICRYVSMYFHIYVQMPYGHENEHKIIDAITTYRSQLIFDPRARIKTRLACFISLFSFGLVRRLY